MYFTHLKTLVWEGGHRLPKKLKNAWEQKGEKNGQKKRHNEKASEVGEKGLPKRLYKALWGIKSNMKLERMRAVQKVLSCHTECIKQTKENGNIFFVSEKGILGHKVATVVTNWEVNWDGGEQQERGGKVTFLFCIVYCKHVLYF